MVKKAKFPLDMGNEVMVRSIEELKENYNAEKVTEYFLNGKLLTWLEDRYYDEEAEQVRELDQQSGNNPAVKLAKIFGVEINESVDVEALEIRREKLEKLREITSEDEILDNVDHVAFSQEELGELLDDEVEVIYLCGESFRIPLSVKNVRYVGVNNPAVTISGKGKIDLEANGIIIERCELPEEIKGKITESARNTDSEYKIKVYVPKPTPTLKSNNTVLAAEYDNETLYIYFRLADDLFGYENGYLICASHKKSGEVSLYDIEYYDTQPAKKETAIGGTINSYVKSVVPTAERFYQHKHKYVYNGILSKTKVYAIGESAYEMYKIQMLKALDNLPKEFKKKDGFVDTTDGETTAAIDEAIRLFVEHNNLNQIDINDDDEY